MEKTKDILKGIGLIILIPIAFNILSSIGNVVFELIETFFETAEFNMGRTNFKPFMLSSGLSYFLIHAGYYKIAESRIYLIIGIIICIIGTSIGMWHEQYEWYYYLSSLLGIFFMVVKEDNL